MSHCCSAPTEVPKADPENLMLHELHETSPYLRELAALRAHYPSVRLAAIAMLETLGLSVLQRIIDKEPLSAIGVTATKQRQGLQ